MEKEKRKRTKYTPEFKAEAVALVLNEGKRISDVALDLDIHYTTLGKWVQQAKIDRGKGPEGALTTKEKEELMRLRKENRFLRMEREIISLKAFV